jgi:uncharacterized membrane protein
MKVYKVLPEYVEQMCKMVRRMIGCAGLISIFVSMYILNNGEVNKNFLQLCLISIIPSIVVFLLVMKFVMKQARKSWSTYEIIIEEQYIKKTQKATGGYLSLGNNSMFTDVKIHKTDISSISEKKNGVMITSSNGVIFIPKLIEGYEEIKSILGQWLL